MQKTVCGQGGYGTCTNTKGCMNAYNDATWPDRVDCNVHKQSAKASFAVEVITQSALASTQIQRLVASAGMRVTMSYPRYLSARKFYCISSWKQLGVCETSACICVAYKGNVKRSASAALGCYLVILVHDCSAVQYPAACQVQGSNASDSWQKIGYGRPASPPTLRQHALHAAQVYSSAEQRYTGLWSGEEMHFVLL